ncbi:MAG: Uncharacterised protein [Cryomorphaceae bacterium]|nr:MAG: Uncharacterised protein [Cryomorphaceae bacterium]
MQYTIGALIAGQILAQIVVLQELKIIVIKEN